MQPERLDFLIAWKTERRPSRGAVPALGLDAATDSAALPQPEAGRGRSGNGVEKMRGLWTVGLRVATGGLL